MESQSHRRTIDFYLQLFFVFALVLVLAGFLITRVYFSKLFTLPVPSAPLDLFRNDIYKIELDIAQKKSELTFYQTQLAKKYADYRAEINRINSLNLPELEKKQRMAILQNSYPESGFTELQTKINQTLKELKALESSKCDLSCKAF